MRLRCIVHVRAKRTLTPGYLDRTPTQCGPGDALFGPKIIEHQNELGVVGVSTRHRLFGSKHRLSKPKRSQLVAVQLLRAQRHLLRTNAHALLLPRQLVLSSLSCAARFTFFMEGTGMSEASKQRDAMRGVSVHPGTSKLWVKNTEFAK